MGRREGRREGRGRADCGGGRCAHGSRPPGVHAAASVEAALALLQEDPALAGKIETVYIIGGGEIYRHALSAGLVDRIYLTRVRASPACDTFLPAPETLGFRSVYQSYPQTDPATGTGYQFEVLDRANAHPALPFGAAMEALLFAQMMA